MFFRDFFCDLFRSFLVMLSFAVIIIFTDYSFNFTMVMVKKKNQQVPELIFPSGFLPGHPIMCCSFMAVRRSSTTQGRKAAPHSKEGEKQHQRKGGESTSTRKRREGKQRQRAAFSFFLGVLLLPTPLPFLDVAAFPPRSFGWRCCSLLSFWVTLLSSIGQCGFPSSPVGVALLPSSSFQGGEEAARPSISWGGRGHHSATHKERGRERLEKVAPPEREEGGKHHTQRKRNTTTAHEEEGESCTTTKDVALTLPYLWAVLLFLLGAAFLPLPSWAMLQWLVLRSHPPLVWCGAVFLLLCGVAFSSLLLLKARQGEVR